MLSWVEIVRPNLEENTYAGYRGIIEKRIAPFFRSKKTTLGELKPIHIQEFYTFCQNTLHVSNNIQAWLGHSTYNTTANFNAHLDTASKTLVGEAMESMLTVPLSTPMDGLLGQSSIHRWQAAL